MDGCSEKQEYKDEETGARVIRLTNNSKYNDMHAYFDMSPWSPDGSKIVFSSSPAGKDGGWRDGKVNLMDADGTNIRCLADAPGICSQIDTNLTKWAGDGKSVYFFTYDQRRMHSEFLLRRVFLDRRPPSVLDTLSGPGKVVGIGNFYLWNVSEATGRLLSTDSSGLYSYAADGSDKQQLASLEEIKAGSPTKGKNPPRRELWHGKWNADGSKCLVVLHGQGCHEIHVVNADGSDLHFCSNFGGHPIWHPKENRILSCTGGKLCLVDADGKGKQIVSSFGTGHPSYNPDGNLICTDTIGGKGKGYVYLVDPKTGKQRKLCNAPTLSKYKPVSGSCHPHPVWSRDGKSIIFECNQSGTAQLYQVFIS